MTGHHHVHRHLLAVLAAFIGTACLAGCNEANPPASQSDTTPRVASLSPAATDLLLGMGAGDRLVAASNYDADPRVADLPRVGDYQAFDWEQLADVQPTVIVVQVGANRLPPGAADKAKRLGARFVNAKIDRLADIRRVLGELATVAGVDADAAVERFDESLGAPAGANGRPRVLVLLNTDLTFSAGRGNYIDDLIEHVGGQNALGNDFAAWPQLDRETLVSLAPAAVVLLLPGATDATIAEARANWRQLAGTALPPWEAVTVVTDDYAMVPGWRVVELAERLRAALGEAGV